MPPKYKFTKEQVVEAALSLAREGGMEAVTARALGQRLGASARPVFSLYESMEQVKEDALRAAYARYREAMARELSHGEYPPYKACGIAYIRFAAEEPSLFRLLFLRERDKRGAWPDEEEWASVEPLVRNGTGLSGSRAGRLHTEMWALVHGIATMLATGYMRFDWGEISAMLTDVFQGLNTAAKEENGDGCD